MTLELYHAWSKAKKNWYNKEYYKKNRDKWLGEGGYVDRWMLDRARRNGELGDNEDLFRNAMSKHRDYEWKNEDAMRRYTDLDNLITGKKYPNAAAREQIIKERTRAGQEAREYNKKANAVAGDYERYVALRNTDLANRMQNRPQAMMKTQSKTQLLINRTKRASEAAVSKAAEAGKDFVNNWKSGVKSIFKKKEPEWTSTYSGTVGGQYISGEVSSSNTKKKKKKEPEWTSTYSGTVGGQRISGKVSSK